MIKNIVEKLYGIPCWSVKQGHGSFLTFEFGLPHLDIKEPILNSSIENRRYRKVSIQGDWHLWVYCCDWEIFLDDKLSANSESSVEEINRALECIDGQKIIKIEIDPKTADTIFQFDLGGLLTTKHYTDEIDEQWILYEPKGNVLTVRSDGLYSYLAKDAPGEEIWKEITL